MSEWVEHSHPGGSLHYLSTHGPQYEITLEPRPSYCDRGNWIAKVFPDPDSELAKSFDAQDGWPRYYFNLDSAKQEIDLWLRKRGLKCPS